MSLAVNEDIAGRLDEVARILAEQGAHRFRVQAYHQAAAVLRGLARPVSEIFAEEGLAGLEKLPGVGESIARAIRDILRHGRLAMLDRLRGEHDPIALLTSVPGIGKALAWKLHDELGLESLEDLESTTDDWRVSPDLERNASLAFAILSRIRLGASANNRLPDAEKGFRLLFSATPFPAYTAKLEWRREEFGGNCRAGSGTLPASSRECVTPPLPPPKHGIPPSTPIAVMTAS